mmetsp:Transcript_15506/g.58942  ORF Transcript_15506/g.58942 Transcript_15506/m.58942 type:complete len:618 (-) Transcript_15506:273-2126(-)
MRVSRKGEIPVALLWLLQLCLASKNAEETDPEFCPFPPRWAANEPHYAAGETPELSKLIDDLVARDAECLEQCILAMQAIQVDRRQVSESLTACRSCVEADERAKRDALRMALDSNVGCAIPGAPEDRCFVTVRTKYRQKHGPRPEDTGYDGYWTVPEELRGSGGVVKAKCNDCMPTDGAGSILAFLFTLFSGALESGCTFLAASPEQLGHGLSVEAFNDFFRLSEGCVADSDEALRDVPVVYMRANGSFQAPEDLQALLDERPSLRVGYLYYASRNWVKGDSLSYALRLAMPIGGFPVCRRKHVALLARLLLRGKFELAQDRQLEGNGVPPPSERIASSDLAKTQVARSAWFDPLRQEHGRTVINVVVHVRRGDVVHNLSNNGMYRQHYTPFHIITTALKVLMLSWGPLAETLGIKFAFYVASEGDETSFPVDEWEALLSPHELHFRLRPYHDMKSVATEESNAASLNVTALQTLGNMMDADVLLCDGKSLFSLTANLYNLGSAFLTYPWLLNMGEPLDKTIRLKQGDIDAPIPLEKMKTWPRHPAYTALRLLDKQALFHPGVRFLRHVHSLPDFRRELELLYTYRQRLFLDGLLARVYERKRQAMQRGVHFNVGL